MRELFKLDLKDYDESDELFIRPSSRAIIIKENKVALIYSQKYDYYKFPGGGINQNEDKIDCLVREVKEETGLIVLRNSIQEFGYVIRKQKLDDNKIFYQENYYYFCNVDDKICDQSLDEYESDEGFQLEYVDPIVAINKNFSKDHPIIRKIMIERDAMVLKMLIDEGAI